MNIKCLSPNKESNDAAMKDALSVTRWLEEGAFLALEKEYLEQMIFCIYTIGKENLPDSLLERYNSLMYRHFTVKLHSYTFKFRHTSGTATFSTSFTGNQQMNSSAENVKAQTIQLVRSLVSITNSLEPLPANRLITMKLVYNGTYLKMYLIFLSWCIDTCPPGWQPSLFKHLTEELNSFGKQTLKLDVVCFRLIIWSCLNISAS